MRKHLGAHKQKIASLVVSLCPTDNDPNLTTEDEVSDLKKLDCQTLKPTYQTQDQACLRVYG